jgi:ubiquinone/menaquinone biosynthesis C-methylase UbiE
MANEGWTGTRGARPYEGAGWYYAEYRDRVSAELMELLAQRLHWPSSDRVLDLGSGPGQLAFLVAPSVAEVIAIDPEPDMLEEGQGRALLLGLQNVQFERGSSGDLSRPDPSLGTFRSALMGQSFHWMVDKDQVLRDLDKIVELDGGSVAFVTPREVGVPSELEQARALVHEILQRFVGDVPAGPHPQGRHDPFDEILRRSRFPNVETIERTYQACVHPTPESLIGSEYTVSYVLSRLGDRRRAFELAVRQRLEELSHLGDVFVIRRDEALIGFR